MSERVRPNRYGTIASGIEPEEALRASTLNAAYAMGLEKSVGSLERGKLADLLVLDVEDFRHIPFYVGRDIIDLVIKAGNPVAGKRHIPPSSTHPR